MVEVSACPNQVFSSGGLRVFQNTGSFKSADWLHFVTTGILHVLKPMLTGNAHNALVALVSIFRLLLNASSDRDPLVVAFPEDDIVRREEQVRTLKLKIVRLLCAYEKGAPTTNMPRIVHLLLHVPDLIFRWNAVRNMWCFFNERFLGWLKGFVHDRAHSTENIVRCYGRVTVIRRAPTDTREALLQRYETSGLSFPATSFLMSVGDRMDKRGSRAGKHEVSVTLSRRNHKRVPTPETKEPLLWRLLRQEFPNKFRSVRIIHFRSTTGLSVNGFPVSKGQWFGFDYDAAPECKVGRVKDAFACTFGSNTHYQCFVYMDTWQGTQKCNLTDFTINFQTRCTTQAIPLKCLSSALWVVSHWNPEEYPPKSCLLFVKHL